VVFASEQHIGYRVVATHSVKVVQNFTVFTSLKDCGKEEKTVAIAEED